jgi:hypothetical protein
MSTRGMRRLFRLVTAIGIGTLMSVLGAALAFADHGPGPWP